MKLLGFSINIKHRRFKQNKKLIILIENHYEIIYLFVNF